MGRLPTAESLGQRSFQDRSFVVKPNVDFSGANALGSAVTNIVEGRIERLDASSLHKAKIQFQKNKLEADAAFDQDPDFETYQSRYDEKMKSAMEESAKLVRNPRDRERFARDMSLYTAEGSQRMIAKAFGKEAKRGLSDLDETLTVGRENYLRASSGQDKQFALNTMQEAIKSARGSTYIDETEEKNMEQELALGLAVASIEVEPPEVQLKLLKSKQGIFNDIPLDVRTKMIANVETQIDAQVSLDMANVIREEGGTREERMVKVNKVKDPKVKASLRAQVLNDFNVEKVAEGEEKYTIYDEAAKGIIEGKDLNGFIAEMPAKWNSLGSKEQSALISMASSKSPTKTDLGVYNNLAILKGEDRTQAQIYFYENVSSFSQTEAKKQIDYFANPVEPKPLFNITNVFNEKVKELKLSGDSLGAAKLRITEEYDTWARDNPGKTMDLTSQNEIVNTVFDEVVGTGTWFSKRDRQFELPREEVAGIKANKIYDADQAKINKEVTAYTAAYKAKYNREPPEENLFRLTEKMVQAGEIQDYWTKSQ
jgi:hypothetical protein